MGDDHLKERGREGVGKLVDPRYQWHQLGMFRVIFLEVPTPKNNPVHNCESNLATAEPNDEDGNVEVPPPVGREEPLSKPATLRNESPAGQFRPSMW